MMKAEIIEKEQELLRMLVFDVLIPQPFKCLLTMVKYIKLDPHLCYSDVVKRSSVLFNNISFDESILRQPCINVASAVLWLVFNDLCKAFNKYRFVDECTNNDFKIIADINQLNEAKVEIDNVSYSWWSWFGLHKDELCRAITNVVKVMNEINGKISLKVQVK